MNAYIFFFFKNGFFKYQKKEFFLEFNTVMFLLVFFNFKIEKK